MRNVARVLRVLLMSVLLAQACAAATVTEMKSFGSNPGHLSMFTYVPEGLPVPAALVVVMHGCRQTAAQYFTESGWKELADRWRFAVATQRSCDGKFSAPGWLAPDADDHHFVLTTWTTRLITVSTVFLQLDAREGRWLAVLDVFERPRLRRVYAVIGKGIGEIDAAGPVAYHER